MGQTIHRRKRRSSAGIVLFILAVLAAALVLCVIMFFKIEEISVSGSERYPQADIVTVSGVELQENIFTLSTKLAQEKIAAQFPYIKTVKVSRRLPNTVEITLTEETGRYAAMNGPESYTLLSAEGRVLEQVYGASPEGFFPLYGADLSAYAEGGWLEGDDLEAIRTVAAVTAAIEESGFENVSYLDISDRLCLYMLYDGRALVKLGTQLDMEYKLKVTREVLENQLAADFTGTLDVTISGKAYSKACDIDERINEVYLLQSVIQY